jgi:glycosyltransferase involved in cell wall biosynthesis
MPALDEGESLPGVLAALEGCGFRNVWVVDNGSRDDTYRAARAGGARALFCGRRGYGAACLRGLQAMRDAPPEVVVFLDADGADDPSDLGALLGPILRGEADLVLGSRVMGEAEVGALTPVQRFGNGLAGFLIGALWGRRFTDLGPFRAVRWETLEQLEMTDPDFGWTVEMQARAARLGIRTVEVPVRYRRRRAGQSKIAGTIGGSVRAGTKILWVIARELSR